MSWVLYALSLHPEVEAKVYDEINSVCEKFTIEEIEKLKYLDNVINETFRMYPPVNGVWRIALKDDIISGYKIPKGTWVLVST